MTPLEAATPTHGYWQFKKLLLKSRPFAESETWTWPDYCQSLTIRLANDQLVIVRKKRLAYLPKDKS